MIDSAQRDKAVRRLNEYEREFERYGENAILFSYHAAVPVAVTPELLHLIRINFFLDPQDENSASNWQPLPYFIEFEFLMSSLCSQVDEGLYEIEPVIRELLLEKLVVTYSGSERICEIATLLWEYTDNYSPWSDRIGLERAQQLTALNFLAPKKASDWIDYAEARTDNTGEVEREWYVMMRRGLEEQAKIIIHNEKKTVVEESEYSQNELADVFILYSHKDEIFYEELSTHLKLLKRLELISDWNSWNMPPEGEWAQQSSDYVHSAQIILLLVSADVIASGYFENKRFMRDIQQHAEEESLLPIILKPCVWEDVPVISKIQVLPESARAITQWADRDAAWLNVESGIKNSIQRLQSNQKLKKKSSQIFISHRRAYDAAVTGRIYDRMINYFGDEKVFLDLSSIPAGTDFPSSLRQAVADCQVLIIIISPRWLDSLNMEPGDANADWMQLEIEMALIKGVFVIPVLVDGAKLPQQDALPDGLKSIVAFQSFEVRYDPDFNADVILLRDHINSLLERSSQSDLSEAASRLHRSLLTLGYQQQSRLFRRVINKSTAAAILIQGPPDYGQQFLLNRLILRYIPQPFMGKIIKINASRRIRGNNLGALWRDLSSHIGSGPNKSIPNIVKRFAHWNMTNSTILIIYDKGRLLESHIQEFIEKFWMPLIQELGVGNENKLLLFFVSYTKTEFLWDSLFTEKIDKNWQPYQPVILPRLQKFTLDELSDWLDREYSNLPSPITVGDLETLLDQTGNGIPELVFSEIYELCGIDWYEESEKWLRV